jgi:hypothetical protein
MGKYNKIGWNHLREAIKDHVDLWSPAKLRQLAPGISCLMHGFFFCTSAHLMHAKLFPDRQLTA